MNIFLPAGQNAAIDDRGLRLETLDWSKTFRPDAVRGPGVAG